MSERYRTCPCCGTAAVVIVDCGAIALLHDFFGLMTGLGFLGLKNRTENP